ncbi:CoA transferase [Streptomyces sp. NBC_01601]|uniref:CoA transferase n=1 Tax=Streptomyces sp. NBC_01601 TaxID=2975892 RepID=UPI002E27C840|nr:CoA transferase [Streptomyces sp. NBC_01601]
MRTRRRGGAANRAAGIGEGAATVRGLLRGADVFYANRRPGYLARFGLTAQEAAEVRPGIIHTSVTLHGERGPWADRVGFDQTAGCVTGMMTLEGSAEQPELPYIKVVNDYLVPWLATAGIVAALRRRAREGGSYSRARLADPGRPVAPVTRDLRQGLRA